MQFTPFSSFLLSLSIFGSLSQLYSWHIYSVGFLFMILVHASGHQCCRRKLWGPFGTLLLSPHCFPQTALPSPPKQIALLLQPGLVFPALSTG